MDVYFLTFWQYFVLATGVLDSFKYKFISNKICRYKSSKEQSRKMINLTIVKNVALGYYSYYYLNDWFIAISCFVAVYTASEAFYYAYLHYPYKNRKKKGWKRPSMWEYLVHSLTPNKYAKKL